MRKSNKFKKPELLAPAGNQEKARTAFAFGADAVYLGVPEFSLRTRINDFDLETVRETVAFAHSIEKRAYVTLNIFAHNYHLDRLKDHVNELKEINPDGLFISDPGVLVSAREIWPQGNYILSTQANCTNWKTAEFWRDLGLSRVILGRELSLNETREIREKVPGLEIECFVHGALCMAYSGRCFLSKQMKERDANLGDCVQPCRWKYRVENKKYDVKSTEGTERNVKERKNKQAEYSNYFLSTNGVNGEFEIIEESHGSYILNSHDLCLIRRMPDLIEAGIDAFKIEGRAKSVYYIACVVGAYRKAIDHAIQNEKFKNNEEVKNELEVLFNELNTKLVHRGYTEGFMFGQGELAQNLDNSHNECDWEFCGQVVKLKNSSAKGNFIKVHNSLNIGDEIEVVRPGYRIIKMKVKSMFDIDGSPVESAHGGQGQTVIIKSSGKWEEYSVIRRKM